MRTLIALTLGLESILVCAACGHLASSSSSSSSGLSATGTGSTSTTGSGGRGGSQGVGAQGAAGAGGADAGSDVMPNPDCPTLGNAATFLGKDTTTQGAWKGIGNFNAPPASPTLVYGKDGDILPDTVACDQGCNPFPAYVSFGPKCVNAATPDNIGDKPYATHAYVAMAQAQGPASIYGPEPSNPTNTSYFQCNFTMSNPLAPWALQVAWRPTQDTREISEFYTCQGIKSFYLELSFGLETHNLEVYVVDDQEGTGLNRTERIQVLDGDTDAVLYDSGVFTDFTDGVYYQWSIAGHVKIKAIDEGSNGRPAAINGVFFD